MIIYHVKTFPESRAKIVNGLAFSLAMIVAQVVDQVMWSGYGSG
jgi:hypothetical protein